MSRTLAYMQAMIGSFYMAVVVASLVSARRWSGNPVSRRGYKHLNPRRQMACSTNGFDLFGHFSPCRAPLFSRLQVILACR